MEIRQAITTKRLAPTDQRGSRISVRCEAGRIIVSYDYSMSSEQNYIRAAYTLFNRLGWDKAKNSIGLAGGAMHTGEYVFISIFND